VTLDYLVILLLLGLGIIALGYILEARSREAGVDLDGIRLRPWAADKYAGRRYVDRVLGKPYPWAPSWRPESEAEYRLALEAGWHAPADWWPGYRDDEALRAAGLLLHDHRGIVDPRNMPDGWPDHFPASPGEYRMAVEAGWHDPDKGGPS